MGWLHNFFFNSNHEKCGIEIEDLKLTIARFTKENDQLKKINMDLSHEKISVINTSIRLETHNNILIAENALLSEALHGPREMRGELETVLSDLLAKHLHSHECSIEDVSADIME